MPLHSHFVYNSNLIQSFKIKNEKLVKTNGLFSCFHVFFFDYLTTKAPGNKFSKFASTIFCFVFFCRKAHYFLMSFESVFQSLLDLISNLTNL